MNDAAPRPSNVLTTLAALVAALCCAATGLVPAASARANGSIATADSGRRLVFAADFGKRGGWGWQSDAFSRCVTNPHQHNLDLLSRSALSARGDALTITARPRPDGLWSTGLLTTGDSCSSGGSGFQERTGDYVVAHVRLPGREGGAWPALWSWRAGGNEVDLFEWHSAAPHRLEFVNHVRQASTLWTSPLVAPGAWLWLGVRLGADRVTWDVGTSFSGMRPAWHDNRGVGRYFAAYPVVSLSVDDGSNYPRPVPSNSLAFTLDRFQVYR